MYTKILVVLLVAELVSCGNGPPGSPIAATAGEQDTGGSASMVTNVQAEPAGATQDAWAYEQKIDPVTKVRSAKAQGKLIIVGFPSVVADVSIYCKTPIAEDAEAQIALFNKTKDSTEYVPLELTREGRFNVFKYRFDGIVMTGMLTRTYANETTIRFGFIDSETIKKNKGKIHATYKREYAAYTFGGKRDYSDNIVTLRLDDVDFAANLVTSMGDISIEFSLGEPAIKKVLRDCGYEYP
jgi:hypothetical protein